jgi:hypothetical protein
MSLTNKPDEPISRKLTRLFAANEAFKRTYECERCVRLDWNKRPERRSAGDGRGADKKPDLPFTEDKNRFGDGSKGSKLHHHNGGRSSYSGHGRVHDDAELTVIRIRLIRVQVSGLGDGQHGQQNEAQSRDRNH